MAGTRRIFACTKQLLYSFCPCYGAPQTTVRTLSLPSAAARRARMLTRTRSCASMMPLYRCSPLQAISACLAVPTRAITTRCRSSARAYHPCTCRNSCRFSCPPKGADATPTSVANRSATEQSQTNSADAAVVILAPSSSALDITSHHGAAGPVRPRPYISWGWHSQGGL